MLAKINKEPFFKNTFSHVEQSTPKKTQQEKMLLHNFPRYSSRETKTKCGLSDNI